MSIYVLLAIAVTFFILWAYFTAQRLNRLHIRTDSALQALQAALDRRAALAQALIPAAIEPAARVQDIALEYSKFDKRAKRERELNDVIVQSGELPPLIADANARVQLAHRFYNDAVSDTRALRTRPLVRLFRLGGTAKLPEYFELSYPETGEF